MDTSSYYKNPAILSRILEFCGVPSGRLHLSATDTSASLSQSDELKEILSAATNEYISAYGQKLLELNHKDHASMKTYMLGWALDNGLDIHRSIWDRESSLGVLDVEYFSKVFPGEPYINPERTFTLMEPIYDGILDVLARYKVSPLVVTTGQGYNFILCVGKGKKVFRSLVALGHVEPTLRCIYEHPSSARGRPVPEEDYRAFDAIGKLYEYTCHRIINDVRSRRPGSVPLTVGDIVCDNEKREAVSLDLSLYTHPLHKRSVRCPFSVYSKHILKPNILGDMSAGAVGDIFCVPRRTQEMELSLKEVLETRKGLDAAVGLAGRLTTPVPDQSEGVENLIKAYKRSALYSFHREYDAVEQDDVSEWPQGYDSFDLSSIPPCVAQVLRYPNPLLLQPTNLRTLVRFLTAIGWHPKHIAGLVYSKYSRDFGWEVDFTKYDPNRWANTWVRIYAGMIMCGTDDLLDFGCQPHQQKGEAWMGVQYCPSPDCGFSLADYCSALKSRI